MTLTASLLSLNLAFSAVATPDAVRDGARQAATPLIPDHWQVIYDDWGFAPALRFGDEIWVSGMIVRPAGPGDYETRYRAGLRLVFEQLDIILAEEGATRDDIIEMTSFHTDVNRQMPIILEERRALMREPHPAWTAVGTTGLAVPDGLTEIKFYVRLDRPDQTNSATDE